MNIQPAAELVGRPLVPSTLTRYVRTRDGSNGVPTPTPASTATPANSADHRGRDLSRAISVFFVLPDPALVIGGSVTREGEGTTLLFLLPMQLASTGHCARITRRLLMESRTMKKAHDESARCRFYNEILRASRRTQGKASKVFPLEISLVHLKYSSSTTDSIRRVLADSLFRGNEGELGYKRAVDLQGAREEKVKRNVGKNNLPGQIAAMITTSSRSSRRTSFFLFFFFIRNPGKRDPGTGEFVFSGEKPGKTNSPRWISDACFGNR